MHFRTKFFPNTFSLSSFAREKPLWFVFIIENNLKAIFVETAFSGSDEPVAVDYCRLIFYDFLSQIKNFEEEKGIFFYSPEHNSPLRKELFDWKKTLTTQGKGWLWSKFSSYSLISWLQENDVVRTWRPILLHFSNLKSSIK